MRRGLVLFACLYSSWSLAETRTAEVCLTGSAFVREVNHTRGDLTIDVLGGDADPRDRLLALLGDRGAVINVANEATAEDVIRAVREDGAIVSPGLKGTSPDCVNVVAGHDAWARLSSSEYAGR